MYCIQCTIPEWSKYGFNIKGVKVVQKNEVAVFILGWAVNLLWCFWKGQQWSGTVLYKQYKQQQIQCVARATEYVIGIKHKNHIHINEKILHLKAAYNSLANKSSWVLDMTEPNLSSVGSWKLMLCMTCWQIFRKRSILNCRTMKRKFFSHTVCFCGCKFLWKVRSRLQKFNFNICGNCIALMYVHVTEILLWVEYFVTSKLTFKKTKMGIPLAIRYTCKCVYNGLLLLTPVSRVNPSPV